MMLTAACESLTAGLEELKPLLPKHYEELSLHKFHGFPLNPNYAHYLARDMRGEIVYVAVRSGGALVGYFIGFLAPALHYQECLTLTMDILYVIPEARGEGGGQVLLKEVERVARARGVHVIWMGNKEHSKVHLTKLLQSVAYEHAESYWSKWVGGA